MGILFLSQQLSAISFQLPVGDFRPLVKPIAFPESSGMMSDEL